MDSPDDWYVEMRARSQAVLQLSSRGGLDVVRQPEGSDFDLLLTITGDGERRRARHVGVVVRPGPSRNEAVPPDSLSIRRESLAFIDATFPICMVSISPTDGSGYFR